MAIPKDLEEQLMNVQEVATVLNKSCNTVRYQLAGKVIPYRLIGKSKMFKAEDIRNYLSNSTKYYGDKRKLKGVS